MCFSPGVSFAVGGALLPVGGYCVLQAWKKDPRLLPFSVIPALLGVQQISEGFVWCGLESGDPSAARPPALAFLFFALAFWPFWLPVAAAAGETRPGRRPWLIGFAILATGWFWVLFFPLLNDPSAKVTPSVVHHSICYTVTLPVDAHFPRGLIRFVYLSFIVVPLVLGPRLAGWLPGLLLLGSAAVAMAVFEHAFASVWCFFAALLGLCLCRYFSRLPGDRASGTGAVESAGPSAS
jgi:hypothetical protein